MLHYPVKNASGNIEIVPEPKAEMGTLVGVGAIAASFLIRQRSRKAISSLQ